MLFVDPRVGSKHLAPLFEAMGVPFDITPLAFGDVSFFGNGPDDSPVSVGIEVKGGRAGSDFLQSMQSGRLVGHQVEGIGEMYDRRYLIVEGLRVTGSGVIWMPPRRGKMRPIFKSDVEKYLTGIEESGIRVRRTVDPDDTARVIAKELYAFWQKPYDEHSSIPANVLYQAPVFSVTREDEATARVRRVAVALKAGIGVTRSKAVAQAFRSIEEMVGASVSEWADVEGIGKTIAGEVWKAFRAQSKTATTTTATARRHLPAARVSTGIQVAPRSTRRTRRVQNAELDTGRGAERRVPQARRGGRKVVRHQPE